MSNKKRIYVITLVVISMFIIMPFTIQGRAVTTTVELTYKFSNLANPGADHYEGWLIGDGNAISTGSFTVDDQGNLKDLSNNTINSQTVSNIDLSKVSKYVLTLEPSGDSDPAPSSIKPLAGDFSDNKADLTPNLGVSLDNISGGYILATPSDGANTNENSGIWWLDPNAGPGASLNFPNLTNTAWVYEGWIVFNATPVSTGKFNTSAEFDSFDGYSGTQGYPPFPGEDFLKNAPSGLSFPTNLAGTKAVISIEPRNDNSPAPFQFKPLVANIPTNAVDHHYYSMTDNSAAMASGSVTIKDTTTNAPFDGTYEAIFTLVAIFGLVRAKKRTNR